MIEHINKQALETPDLPENQPFVKGTVRGKKWMPPPPDKKQIESEEKIAIDLGEEYEQALNDASQEEIIDLAGMYSIYSHTCSLTRYNFILNKRKSKISFAIRVDQQNY